MKKDLAIIIPAYKPTYLELALKSIANQTCKDFTVYIGDDCSPFDLHNIISSFYDTIDIVYKRFDKNFGGTNLVDQWKRCIELSKGESWIWLFSDDDIMSENCVEQFYNVINENKQAKLIHFDVTKIDRSGNVVFVPASYPKYMTSKQYLDSKLRGNIISFVVEFIVAREIYEKCHGFQNFDLAWGSDFISWIKFSDAAKGIYTCSNSMVFWRSSGDNISTDYNRNIIFRKVQSVISYMRWILHYSQEKRYKRVFFYNKYSIGEIKRNWKYMSLIQNIKLILSYWNSISGFRLAMLKDIISNVLLNNRYDD